jgi:hypothetical protein
MHWTYVDRVAAGPHRRDSSESLFNISEVQIKQTNMEQ